MDPNELALRLDHLRLEHRDLDAAIVALQAHGELDQLREARLKKRKLRLKDEMIRIETMLIPDILA